VVEVHDNNHITGWHTFMGEARLSAADLDGIKGRALVHRTLAHRTPHTRTLTRTIHS
jgi:hypothetical protein